ncbi:MAG: GGDEF domain-containing protein [Desulfovibrio aminophilus]|uniref:GGDEF domain-containing protein n=1 Tax=Desulfovibrio aminophilus TaxID=81425 RepID=UPI002A419F4E|nr:GGDEF domain-containing protein [Desulfovibrionaceae bacterium]
MIPMLDIRTGILLLAFGNCCAAVLLLVHGVGERGRGSRLFLRGKLAQSVGWLFMGLRGLEADMLPILVGNGLLYAGFALESAALLRFSGLLGSWSRRFLIAVVCGALAAQALVFDSPNLRQSLGGLALALCLARPGFLLAFTPGGTALRRFMGAAYLACAGALLANAAVFLLVRTEGHVYTPGADQTIAGLMLYLVMLVGNVGFVLLNKERADAELRRAATVDGLTQALNRATFLARAGELVSMAARTGAPLSLLMLDLDHFKAVNDTHGHAVGDDVLRDFSARVRSRLRPYDLFGRYGGEEFCVLLPATGAEAAVGVAERIRTSMPREPFRDLPAYTVSIGVATLGEHSTLDDLLRESDLAMYQAKAQGRDRVRLQRAGESEE